MRIDAMEPVGTENVEVEVESVGRREEKAVIERGDLNLSNNGLEEEIDEVQAERWKDAIEAVHSPPLECKSGGKVEHLVTPEAGRVSEIVCTQLNMPKVSSLIIKDNLFPS